MPVVLLSDPEIAAVTVADNGEPLVDVAARLAVDGRVAAVNPSRGWLRAGLLRRLLAAQEALPAGLRLLIAEGYRPLELQHRHFEEYTAELRSLHPRWDPQRRYREASRYIAPPAVAPHCTGGAVDLTLCTVDGVALDMGTAINDSPVASEDRCYTAAVDVSAAVRANRDLLVAVLTGAGLVNYPTEWWHWSFGERYWAHAHGAQACYGPVGPP